MREPRSAGVRRLHAVLLPKDCLNGAKTTYGTRFACANIGKRYLSLLSSSDAERKESMIAEQSLSPRHLPSLRIICAKTCTLSNPALPSWTQRDISQEGT